MQYLQESSRHAEVLCLSLLCAGNHDGPRAAHHLLHRRHREHRGADGAAPHAQVCLPGLHRDHPWRPGGQEAVQNDLPRL